MAQNAALLQEIRENFDYDWAQWKDIRDAGEEDMRYLLTGPWSKEDRQQRKDAGRLCLSMDELHQYCNQLINDVRQNKRETKVVPKGFGASEQTAEMRAGIIREIQAKSKAQAAYLTAFEGVVHRSYGAWKYRTAYVSDSAFEQELQIVRIPNPNTILMDWDAREADYSDAGHACEIETFRKRAYLRRWPHAKVQSFSSELHEAYPNWIQGEDRIQVASYWKVLRDSRDLVQFDNGKTAFLDELPGATLVEQEALGEKYTLAEIPGGFRFRVVNQRKSETQQVIQYITNGLEILETNEWAGKYIPIVFITGKEMYVDEGSGPKRTLLSLVRLAREPFMAYCYLWTSQMELAQQMPKTPWVGYEGQFHTNTDWANLHKIPAAYAEVRARTKESAAADPKIILPLPQRQMFEVALENLEVAKESSRRAIQAAMGVTGLLSGTGQDRDPKSGIALRTLDQQESTGNFHYIDAYDLGLEHGGRIMDDLLAPVYDSPRHVGYRSARGEHKVIPANQLRRNPVTGAVEKVGFHTDDGDHDVAVTTGPNFLSQREEAQDFAESLTKIDPLVTRTILPEIVKLRDLGPIGDDIAKKLELLDPTKQQIPPIVQQQIQKLTATVQQLLQEKQAKVVEQQGKAFIASAQQQVDLEKKRYDVIGSIVQSLVKAGQETNAAQFAAQMENLNLLWEQLHEFGMQKDQQAHELNLQQQQAALTPQPAQQPAQV